MRKASKPASPTQHSGVWCTTKPNMGNTVGAGGFSFGCRSNLLHQLVHLIFLLPDGFNQLELGAGAVEIVGFPMHLEIDIPLQEVRQEADADLEGDQFA